MKFATRASFQSAFRRVVQVPVRLTQPVNGEDAPEEIVRLREMSGTERDKFEIAAFKEAPDGKRVVELMYLRARLVALCMVDEENRRIYADDEIQQLADDAPAGALNKLFDEAQKLNGLDAAAVEAAAKNSASVPAGASVSDSPLH